MVEGSCCGNDIKLASLQHHGEGNSMWLRRSNVGSSSHSVVVRGLGEGAALNPGLKKGKWAKAK